MGGVQTPCTLDNLFPKFWHRDVISKHSRPETQLSSRYIPKELRNQIHRNESLKIRAINTARKYRRASSPAFENAFKFPSNSELQ